MADAVSSNAHSSSTSQKPGNAAFVTHFMPGLVLGLIVGGLAGAFLPPVLERRADPIPALTPGTSTSAPAPVREDREDRSAPPPEGAPTPTDAPQTPATEANPANPSPATPTPPR